MVNLRFGLLFVTGQAFTMISNFSQEILLHQKKGTELPVPPNLFFSQMQTQVCVDKWIKIAVHDAVNVSDFDIGTMIFDH